MPDDDNMDGGSDAPRSNKRHKSSHGGVSKQGLSLSKGVDALGFEPLTKDSTWVTRSDSDPDFPLVPSAKTTALKALLLKGFEEAPLDKVCFNPIHDPLPFLALFRDLKFQCSKPN
jgi:hypothetical protein